MHPRLRNVVGGLLAAIGVIVILIEFALHVVGAISHVGYEMNHWVLMTGSLFGFIGFFLIDSKGAERAAGIVVNSSVRVIGVIRGGRRSTDAAVIVAEPTIPTEEDKP